MKDAPIKTRVLDADLIGRAGFRAVRQHKSKNHPIGHVPIFETREEAEREARRLAAGAAYHLRAVWIEEFRACEGPASA